MSFRTSPTCLRQPGHAGYETERILAGISDALGGRGARSGAQRLERRGRRVTSSLGTPAAGSSGRSSAMSSAATARTAPSARRSASASPATASRGVHAGRRRIDWECRAEWPCFAHPAHEDGAGHASSRCRCPTQAATACRCSRRERTGRGRRGRTASRRSAGPALDQLQAVADRRCRRGRAVRPALVVDLPHQHPARRPTARASLHRRAMPPTSTRRPAARA